MFTRRHFLEIMGAAGTFAATSSLRGRGTRRRVAIAAELPTAIDRLAILKRHSPRIQRADQEAVLSVGNGNFAFNVDCTGLQSLHNEYKIIPLATLAHWLWHSAPIPEGIKLTDLKYKEWFFYGRKVPYATSGAGQMPLYNYLRENPHMLNMGRIALILDDKPLASSQLSNIDQQLDLHSGVITSRFTLEGSSVEVITCAHPDSDGIALRVSSSLLRNEGAGKLAIEISFGYGLSTFDGSGGDWTQPNAHTTALTQDPHAPRQITLHRTVDTTHYGIRIGWGDATRGAYKEIASHIFQLTASGETLEAVINFDPEPNRGPLLYSFDDARKASAEAWNSYWIHGAAIDLGNATDARAPELERRIVLSQYLTAIHCSGQYPSQETGLLCNSWYGKFHLEMHWWHSVHFTVWNRQKYCDRTMGFYWEALESSRQRARQQGFAGARWPKMTGPDGADSPSPVGPMIAWQQPHPIYYAELAYRNAPTKDTLMHWREIVVETAQFMASYAQFDKTRGEYVLGPVIKTVSENNPTETTLNPTWELTAWRFGLGTAQKWLKRLGEPRNTDWDKVLNALAKASTKNGAYLMQEGMDTYSKEWAWEHPALLGAYGVLPGDGIDSAIMAETVRRVRKTWDFKRVWGWDFPMAALAAARTQQPDLAIDFLTMAAPEALMNRYLVNGCNFQRDNVPAYFPGNGGLLSAIGLMAGGWTGGPRSMLPGFPRDGRWDVRAEGFREWI